VVAGARPFAEEGSFTGGGGGGGGGATTMMSAIVGVRQKPGRYIAQMKFLVINARSVELLRLRRALRDAALKTGKAMTWGCRISARHVKAKTAKSVAASKREWFKVECIVPLD
jgi:hypothetical protein